VELGVAHYTLSSIPSYIFLSYLILSLPIIFKKDSCGFLDFFQHSFICRPTDSAMSEDAGTEPKTCCDIGIDALTTRLDLVHLSPNNSPSSPIPLSLLHSLQYLSSTNILLLSPSIPFTLLKIDRPWNKKKCNESNPRPTQVS
jgi:hypothetical protein